MSPNSTLTDTAIAITDQSSHGYRSIMTQDWPVSNPKGYLSWFRSRMEDAHRQSSDVFRRRAVA